MERTLDRMLRQFETGQLSRRELLGALVAIAGAGRVGTIASAPYEATELNHVTLRVRDLARSTEFYQKLFGAPLIKHDATVAELEIGKSFLSLWSAPNMEPAIEHFCVGVKDFDRETARARFEKDGVRLRKMPDDPTLYVPDPDGLLVQLEAPGFRG